mmetsp:Transcript_71210/g.200977  ORF Transcript_71210/g.200977 Transcript_71210/m.200977 type:complete len:272 (-) Transcript_71210:31-846(-)
MAMATSWCSMPAAARRRHARVTRTQCPRRRFRGAVAAPRLAWVLHPWAGSRRHMTQCPPPRRVQWLFRVRCFWSRCRVFGCRRVRRPMLTQASGAEAPSRAPLLAPQTIPGQATSRKARRRSLTTPAPAAPPMAPQTIPAGAMSPRARSSSSTTPAPAAPPRAEGGHAKTAALVLPRTSTPKASAHFLAGRQPERQRACATLCSRPSARTWKPGTAPAACGTPSSTSRPRAPAPASAGARSPCRRTSGRAGPPGRRCATRSSRPPRPTRLA